MQILSRNCHPEQLRGKAFVTTIIAAIALGLLTNLNLPVAHAQIVPVITASQFAPYGSGSEASGNVRFGAPIQFSARILPANATGSVTFSVDGTPVQTAPLAQQTLADYIAVGDSITAAEYIGDPAQRYQSLIAQSLHLGVISWATPGVTSCDAFHYDILPNGLGLTTSSNPLYSLLIGTNDLWQYGVGPNEALFDLCHQGAISWLGVARPYKVLAIDPGVTSRNGAWTPGYPFGECCSTQVLTNTTGSGTVRFPLTTHGGAAFLWYLLQANTSGSFAVSVDGGSFGAPVSTLLPANPDPDQGTYALLRIPVAAGTHTFDIAAQSGTVSILGMGAAPPAGGASIVPTVLVSDVPNEINGNIAGIAEYTGHIKSNIALLQGDGLDIRFVPTQNYMFATPAEMVDDLHPNALGLSELAQAFEAAITPANPAADSISAATASFSTSTLPIGAHQIAIAYSGDANYAPATAPMQFASIYDGSTTTSLASDSQTYTGQTPVTLTANISSNSVGEVDFLDTTAAGTTNLGTMWLNQPSADPLTLVVPGLPAGQHTLTALYRGDYHWNGSTSPATQVTVVGTSTITTLSTAGTRHFAGIAIPLTATVWPASATGTVTFFDGATPVGQAALASGTAILSLSALAPGIHNLTASYALTATFNASQSPVLSVEIDQNSASVALTSNPASATYGTPVTLATAISPSAATGTLTLQDSFVPLGATLPTAQTLAILPQSNGSYTTSTLAPGTHTVTAAYAGDANDLSANSQPIALQISRDASTTNLAALPASISYGAALQLSAAVTAASSTGMVTFADSVAGTLAQVAVANGTASFSTSTLAPGTHSITATYSGDADRAPSASRPVTTTVNPLASSIFVTQPLATFYAGTPLSLSALISPSTATGTVIFRDATLGVLGSAAVSKANATLTLPNPTAGSYSISATYSGDAFDASSTSAPVSLQVLLNPTTTTLTASSSTAPAAASISLTAAVSPANATGTVTFFDGATPLMSVLLANGVASTTISTLAVGAHTVHATYSGSSIDATSTSAPVSEAITGDTTATTLTLAQASVIAGTTATANVRVTSAYTSPTGSITLRSGSLVLASAPLTNATTGSAYATLSFNSAVLGLGAAALVASYAGDSADQPSGSAAAAVTETVLPIPIAIALTLSAANAPVQGSVTLTATVSATSTPTGSITFLSNGTSIATVPLNAGTASTTFSAAAAGAYVITATYTPSGFFASAPATPPQTLTITPPVTLTLTPNTISAGPVSTESANLLITPNFGFTGAVQTQCQTSATWIACTLTAPASVAAPVSVPVQITVAKTTAALAPLKPTVFAAVLALLLPLLIPRRKRPRFTLLAAAIAAATCMTACGATPYAFPTGSQSATITVTSAGTTTSTTLTINITP